MKYFFIFLLFFLTSLKLHAQGEAVENGYIGDIRAFSKIPFDSFWYYSTDTNISAKNFTTLRNTQKVNTLSLTDEKQNPVAWNGVGWFYQKISVPDSLNGKNIAFIIGHLGTSEVYVDGKKISLQGEAQQKSIVRQSFMMRTPVIVSLDSTANNDHVIVVRYQSNDFDKPLKPKVLKGFIVACSPDLSPPTKLNLDAYHGVVSTTIYLVFALFFFCVFLFYPQRLASLMTVFSLICFPVLFSGGAVSSLTTDPTVFMWANTFWKAAVAVAGQSTIFIIYSLYYQKMPRRALWVFLYLLFSLFATFYTIPFANFITVIASILIGVDCYRTVLLGIREKKPGFKIILAGTIFGTALFWIFIADVFHLSASGVSPYITEIGGFLSDLGFPVMVALQLAYEFGSSNKNLQTQLVQVQQLSHENLEKEQEKQHILSTQNETLERQVTERTSELSHKNRDLEIEAALEKVRSASLAMHNSDELEKVLSVLFEKLKDLGLIFDGGAAIHLFEESTKDARIWVVSPESPTPALINLPYDADAFVNNPMILDVWEAHEKGKHILNKKYSFEEKNRYFNYVFKYNANKVPEFARDFIMSAPGYTGTFINEKYSLIDLFKYKLR